MSSRRRQKRTAYNAAPIHTKRDQRRVAVGSTTPSNDDNKPGTIPNSGAAWPAPGAVHSSDWAWSQPAGSSDTPDLPAQEISTDVAPLPLGSGRLGSKLRDKRPPSIGRLFVVFVLGVLVGAVGGYFSSADILSGVSTGLGTSATSSTKTYIVQSVDSSTLTVMRTDTAQTLTVIISSSTTFKRDDWEATFGEVAVGEKVQIKGVLHNGTLQAGRIFILDSMIEGAVASISGQVVNVTLTGNEPATVTTINDTRFFHFPPWQSATLAQLQIGARIKAFVIRASNGSYIAYEIVMP